MPIYNVIEYGNNYSKTSESLWKYYRQEPDDHITSTKSIKFKSRVTNNTTDNGTLDVEIVVPVIYLGKFQRTLDNSFNQFLNYYSYSKWFNKLRYLRSRQSNNFLQ